MDRPSMLIKVRETEFKPLLDPQKVTADIEQHLRPWINLIRDITNYGSNLIPRCFGSSGRSLKDAVVIGILLRQVVAMLDSVAIPLSNGAVHAAHLQLRALFEASVYIDWILESDSEKKAVYYYVNNLRRKLGTMARAVGKRALYTFLYSGASEVMHTSNYEHHLRMGKGEVTFQAIRSAEGFENVFRYSLNIALMTFRRILAEYRNDELPAFSRKYSENWKTEFINLPKLTVKIDSTRI